MSQQLNLVKPVRRPGWHGAALEQQIEESVTRRLVETTMIFRANIHCDFHEGVLVLRGSVRSYYLKQLAQTTAARVDGVEEVVNWIQVITPNDATAPTSR